jgi:hypothetical protein
MLKLDANSLKIDSYTFDQDKSIKSPRNELFTFPLSATRLSMLP